ncbi:hypothetical protein B0H10DRAFT_1811137, partial [Mycena sp. CBHHK59/15]
QLYVLWDFFIPAFTCPFPMYHVGTLADGGKWVCGLECIIYNCPSPTVYSLGYQSPSYSSFEQDMLGQSTGCQVYGMFSRFWPWGDNKTDIDQNLASRVHFKYTIVDLTAERYRSLQSVMGELGHDFVNILKVIDLEGTEFTTLVSIITDSQENPLPFGQLLLEVHIRWSDDMTTVDHFGKWFARLECAGLRPYYFEVSMMDVNMLHSEPAVVYVSRRISIFVEGC